MQLTRQIEIMLIVLLVLLSTASFLAYRTLVLDSCLVLEQEQLTNDMKRLRAAMEAELEFLDLYAYDYGNWDDTYAYMDSSDPRFIASSLPLSFLTDNRISAVLLYKLDGTLLHQDIRDYRTEQPIEIPELIDPELTNHLLSEATNGLSAPGFIRTNSGPLMVAARNISSSDGKAPSKGLIIFARLIDGREQALLSTKFGAPFTFRELDEAEAAALKQTDGAETLTGDQSATINLLMPGPNAEKYALEFSFGRPIADRAAVSLLTFMSILLATFLATLLGLRWFIQTRVVQPLKGLSERMESITDEHPELNFGPVARQDEIGSLNREFQSMLDRLKKSQWMQREAVDALTRSLDEARRSEALAKLGTYIWDWEAQKMESCSDEFARMRGMTVEEVLKTFTNPETDMESFHPDDRARYEAAEILAIENESELSIEYRIQTKNGDVIHVREVCEYFRDESGQVVKSHGFTQDITGQVELEEKLRQVGKLEAIGQLSGGIAHDFNNMLVVILGNIELATMNLENDPSSLKWLNAATHAALRSKDLTEHLLSFARQQPLAIKPVNATHLITEMNDMLNRTLGGNVNITISANDNISCLTDETQLENALLNLAINARDAMPDGGHLDIGLDKFVQTDDSPVSIEDLKAGDYIIIQMVDSGIGMDSTTLSKAFDPFFTTKKAGEGTGLGLSSVHGFVKQTGGHLTIESQVGKGTTVSLFLPAASKNDADAVESHVLKRSGSGELVLVVEDEIAVAAMAEQMLKKLGYACHITKTAEEAIDYLGGTGKVDYLFSDVVLPGDLNGIDVATYASQQQPDTRILMTSGYPKHIADVSNYHLLRKPYSLSDLSNAMDELKTDSN